MDANEEANKTLDAATDAHSAAKDIADSAGSAYTNLTEILNVIGKLLGEPKTTPTEVIIVSVPLLVVIVLHCRLILPLVV